VRNIIIAVDPFVPVAEEKVMVAMEWRVVAAPPVQRSARPAVLLRPSRGGLTGRGGG
jgi:hypothetical protein